MSNKDRDYHGQNARWNTVQLLSAFAGTGPDQAPRKQVLVWTPTFDIPRPFWVQILFASATGGANGTAVPALPFQPFSSARVKITVTRYIDQFGLGQAVEDSYIINGYNPSATEPAWMPLAIVAARKLTITAEIIDETTGHTQQFVDASASVVDAVDTEQILASRYTPSTDGSATFLPNVFGWGDVPTNVRTPQNVAAVQLLPADQTRRQFWITNEGTARLAIKFGPNDPDVTAGAELWDVILDPKGGAVTRYESPVNAHWGEVRGIWEAAGGGFAVASGASIE